MSTSPTCLSKLTCSLVLKVVFDVVGLQGVHIRASLWRAVMKVVVDHVVHDVATQTPDKHAYPQDIWQHDAEDYIETSHH